MSASSKKQLRNAAQAEKMTEKQLQEQKEAKKLKIFTIAIVAVIILMVIFAAATTASSLIARSGIRERNTVAVTIGEHELSNADFNYFYIDAVNNFVQQYGSYASMFGLDTTKPLDEQTFSTDDDTTWADYFIESATASAQSVYALVDAAEAAGYTLPADTISSIDTTMSNLGVYATLYGYSKAETYIKAIYGSGASEEGLRNYYELNSLADAYYSYYSESLTYDESALREADDAQPKQYNSYSYSSYYLGSSRFLTGGTVGEDGTTTYSDEEKAASVKDAEVAANVLVNGEYADVDAFNAAIAALPVNSETENASSSTYTDNLYSSINSVIKEWVTDDSRQAGDIAAIPSTSTSTDEDGNETTTTNGYYVVLFHGSTDNVTALANVRHILVAFEGGTSDSYGNKTYSDEEKATAKTGAEDLLAQWESGDATEDSFAALANEHSDDGDGTTGGLYEDVYPGQMDGEFNTWCFEEGRKAGDIGIVETSYGFHVIYYVGDSETNYRDYMIESDLRSDDTSSWYTSLTETVTVTEGNTKYLSTDLVLSSN